MIVESVFESQQAIPSKYTCDGDDVSPPLRFLQIPQGAKSLVLIVDDPDAPSGTFDHWVVWNIPPNMKEITEGANELTHLAPPPTQGVNGFGTKGYRGPCPPRGKGAHHYHFKLYALNGPLTLPDKSTKQKVEEAMQGKIVSQAELVGTYEH